MRWNKLPVTIGLRRSESLQGYIYFTIGIFCYHSGMHLLPILPICLICENLESVRFNKDEKDKYVLIAAVVVVVAVVVDVVVVVVVAGLVAVDASLIVGLIIVISVSETGKISLISHTFHPIDFSPGFASSINLQFSVEQSHDAWQIGASLGVPPANTNNGWCTRLSVIIYSLLE